MPTMATPRLQRIPKEMQKPRLAHDRDDVAAGQPEAGAVAQRGLPLRGLQGPPVLGQLDHLSGFLFLLQHSAAGKGEM